MSELALPFVRAWDWIGSVGGVPGQAFLLAAIVVLIIGVLTWLGNRK